MPGSNVMKDDRLITVGVGPSGGHGTLAGTPFPHVIDHVCSSTQKLIRFNSSYLVKTVI